MFDAILLASYGGPEGPKDVEPFLDLILSGKRTPPARRASVVERYMRFGGVSPLPNECRRFLAELQTKLAQSQRSVKVYWGNLFARPFMTDAIEQMERDGVGSVLVLVSSAFGAGPVCRRYVDAVLEALASRSPEFAQNLVVRNVPPFFETRAFRSAVANSIRKALDESSVSNGAKRLVLFSAHSIPTQWSVASHYRRQLLEAAVNALEDAFPEIQRTDEPASNDALFPSNPLSLSVSEDVEQLPDDLRKKLREKALDAALAFQSRSGSPFTPWLGPDVNQFLTDYKKENPELQSVVVVPIGFFFENMETVFDLDVELRNTCKTLGVEYNRVQCAGDLGAMIDKLCELSLKAPEEFPVCRLVNAQCDFSCRLSPSF